MKKWWGRILVVLFFAIPVIWIVIWKKSEHTYITPPVYGDVEFNGDTTPFVIRDFKLVNQEGDSFSQANLEGKIYVANFFFASCPEVCPTMNKNFRLVVDKFRRKPNVAFISHSVDPYNDSVAVLKAYAKDYNGNAGKWDFLTGHKSEIYDLAQNYYRVNATKGNKPADFIHSEKLILIDANKNIRGYFESSDANDIKDLIDAIKVLLKEDSENHE